MGETAWIDVEDLTFAPGTVVSRFPKYAKLCRLRSAVDATDLPPIEIHTSSDGKGFYVTNGKHRLILARERGWPRLKAVFIQRGGSDE